ncbi:CGNR zinc finger domain-containing protein [Kineococcus sp. NBC_00420]|uniref:CGNR zinc finger domain-containing protein n=1 Tax=unclassified Kineococcus TaxID=2621656 RepID=UPI002E240431
MTDPDEELLLGLLNSTPVVDGRPQDLLTTDAGERPALVRARDLLQSVVRGDGDASLLQELLVGVTWTASVGPRGIERVLRTTGTNPSVVRAVLAWDTLERERPGRLRPCANSECRLFFVDRSRAGTGRWCSMAVCGNRMKARRHHSRVSSQDA